MPPNLIQFRPFRPNDRATVLQRLQPDWLRKTTSILQDDEELGAFIDKLLRPQIESGQRVKIACVDGDDQPIGAADIYDIDRRARHGWVGLFLFNETLVGRGIGSRLLQYTERYAISDLGLVRLYAKVFVDNAPSHRLFRSEGWSLVATIPELGFSSARAVDVDIFWKKGSSCEVTKSD